MPAVAPAWPAPSAANGGGSLSEDVIEDITRRVLDRLSDQVVRNTVAALAQLEPTLLESSAVLGASRLYTFRRFARLWGFDVAGPGELAPPPGFAPGRVVKNLDGFNYLDSLAVEAGGKVCVATIINGGITAFDPSGETEHYPFPDLVCTNICFGGSDMMDAWVTASSTGKLYKVRWPRPGLKLNFNA